MLGVAVLGVGVFELLGVAGVLVLAGVLGVVL